MTAALRGARCCELHNAEAQNRAKNCFAGSSRGATKPLMLAHGFTRGMLAGLPRTAAHRARNAAGCPDRKTSAIFVLTSTLRPTECPIGLALYVSRAFGAVMPHVPDLGPLHDALFGNWGFVSASDPVT
jgi:hypothetical protein